MINTVIYSVDCSAGFINRSRIIAGLTRRKSLLLRDLSFDYSVSLLRWKEFHFASIPRFLASSCFTTASTWAIDRTIWSVSGTNHGAILPIGKVSMIFIRESNRFYRVLFHEERASLRADQILEKKKKRLLFGTRWFQSIDRPFTST